MKTKSLLLFLPLLFFSLESFSQISTNKLIKDNSIEIKDNLLNLLSNNKWKIEKLALSKKNRVKKITNDKYNTTWEYDSLNNHLIKKGFNESVNKEWTSKWEVKSYEAHNTILIKFSEIQFHVYKIIKAQKNYIILQEINKFSIDRQSGKIYTKDELKKRNGKGAFGGMVISIGGNWYERILLKKVNDN